jgi:DNA replication protein DnaC
LAKTDVSILEDRLYKKSVIVVSQFPIGTWDRVFEDKTTADAVMELLVHVAFPLGYSGPSLRQQAASDELRALKRYTV